MKLTRFDRTADSIKGYKQGTVQLLADGTLFVNGTDGDDAIDVIPKGEKLLVSYRGKQRTWSTSSVRGIVIAAGKGNDSVDGLGAKVRGMYVELGSGNDTVQGGNNDDTLIGNAGNDLLRGAQGNDHLYGQDGNDMLFGANGMDELFGGDGRDTLYASNGGTPASNDDRYDILTGGKDTDVLELDATPDDDRDLGIQ
ncbi:MAG: hypothetical protein QM702_03645 [Rubrivivax sp.]